MKRRGAVVVLGAIVGVGALWACSEFGDETPSETTTDAGGNPPPAEGSVGVDGPVTVPPSPPVCPDAKRMKMFATTSSSFCIDRLEVTTGEYAAFAAAATVPQLTGLTTSVPPECGPSVALSQGVTSNPESPSRDVSFCSAAFYCASVGKRMCGSVNGGAPVPFRAGTDHLFEHEWFVACTNNSPRDQPWPANTDAGCRLGVDAGPRPVGSDPSCGFDGVLDQIGNVAEWVAERTDDAGSAAGGARSATRVMGGDYESAKATNCKLPHAILGPVTSWGVADPHVGFRCCATPK